MPALSLFWGLVHCPSNWQSQSSHCPSASCAPQRTLPHSAMMQQLSVLLSYSLAMTAKGWAEKMAWCFQARLASSSVLELLRDDDSGLP